uniref:EF-hand domain-containing protein n=1 Tax=Dunaliella tertiolecta TaxID=3047 RepID=A0A7S3QZ31_DUNTE
MAKVELSDAEVKEFREIFDFMDRDKGGTLGIQEIKQLTDMLGMRISPDELDNIMKQIDADNSGQVDFDEFLQVMARPQQLPYTRKDVLRAFAMFAKNGEPEGYINPEKLEEALVSC